MYQRSIGFGLVVVLSVSLMAAGSDLRLTDAVMLADREAVRTLLQQKIDILLLSMMDRVGVHRDSFGDSTGRLDL